MEGCGGGSPGGIDVELLCLLNRAVSALTGQGGGATPEGMAPWFVVLALAALGSALVVLALRAVVRRGARAALRVPAPTVPRTYWQCGACRALNRSEAAGCYSCGAAYVASAGVELVEPPRDTGGAEGR